MTFHGEPAMNSTGHEEPTLYVCPGCSLRLDFSQYPALVDEGLLPLEEWTARVRAVREHLVTAHGWHHLPPSTDGTAWHFPEDYPA